MPKLLLVGDPHATVEDLQDCQKLLDLVLEVANATHPDKIVFMGDQHHTHAVVRIEVLDFWSKNINTLMAAGHSVLMLVGNHDRSHDTAISAHGLKYRCQIVSDVLDEDGVRYIAWTSSADHFVKESKGADIVICHQTFDGGRYENGFYAQDGIDVALIDAKQIVSGHIHTPQEFGRVWYPGAPRWRIATDANTERAIWLFDTETMARKSFSTAGFCTSLYHIEDREGIELAMPEIVQPARIVANIFGSHEYIASKIPFWKAQGARHATFPTKASRTKVKESDGVSEAIVKYVDLYQATFGTPKDTLKRMVAERINV